ncbi:MAG: hypothetical protein WDW36_006336 [Sanguina aurantia]
MPASTVGVARLLSDTLANVSCTVVGDDSELNWALADVLGRRIGYTATRTAKIIAGTSKVADISTLSREALVASEAGVLKGLRTQSRVVSGTLGSGATSLPETYDNLYGSFILWVDEVDSNSSTLATPARRLFEANSDIRVRIRKAGRGFAASQPTTPEERVTAVIEAILVQLNDHVAERLELIARKQQYVRLGCRGDWPLLQPAGWTPVLEKLERPAPELPL